MRHLTNGLLGDREMEITSLSCLRAAVMAAAEKRKHEEVKAKFGLGPFQTKKMMKFVVNTVKS